MAHVKMGIIQEDLKNLLVKKFLPIFEDHGYIFHKSNFSFKKENTEIKIEFYFYLYSCYPSHQEYTFTSNFILKPIKKIINEYLKYSKTEENFRWHLIISEGEFIYELIDKNRKFKDSYVNEVDTIKNAETAVEQSLAIIKTQLFPLIEKISSLEGFQKYYFDPKKILYRVSQHYFVLTILFAAYLDSYQLFKEIFNFIRNELEIKTKNGEEWSEIIKLLNSINIFIINKENFYSS